MIKKAKVTRFLAKNQRSGEKSQGVVILITLRNIIGKKSQLSEVTIRFYTSPGLNIFVYYTPESRYKACLSLGVLGHYNIISYRNLTNSYNQEMRCRDR